MLGVMDVPLTLPRPSPSYGEVRLRALRENDIAMLQNLATDPYVPAVTSLPACADADAARAFIDRQHARLTTGQGYSFCLATVATDEAVGHGGLWLKDIEEGRATAGYGIAPRSRGHGYAGQALIALTRFAWSVPEVHRIELYIEPWNAASVKTAEVAGYEREGLLRSHQVIRAKRVDMLLYAMARPTS